MLLVGALHVIMTLDSDGVYLSLNTDLGVNLCVEYSNQIVMSCN